MDEINSQAIENTIKNQEVRNSQSVKKSAYPWVLMIVGAISIVIPISFIVFVLPQVYRLQGQLKAPGVSPNTSAGLLISLLVLFAAEFIYGVWLFQKQKVNGELSKGQKRNALFLFVVGVVGAMLIIPMILIAVIQRIYQLTSLF